MVKMDKKLKSIKDVCNKENKSEYFEVLRELYFFIEKKDIENFTKETLNRRIYRIIKNKISGVN